MDENRDLDLNDLMVPAMDNDKVHEHPDSLHLTKPAELSSARWQHYIYLDLISGIFSRFLHLEIQQNLVYHLIHYNDVLR
jgi:hypothetical protein